jgi:nitrite reductase (NO-forming)
VSDDGGTADPSRVLRASPFATTAPAIVSALLFGAASLVWLVAGRWLPGTRWVVVHLFTLGVLTTLIAAFTLHFATSFTGQGAPSDRRRALVVAIVLDASVVMLLVGRLTHGKALLSLGTVGLLGVVGVNFLALRRARRNARAPRFVWIVRRYEDAHLAFLVAATLGTIAGIGAVSGGWYAGVRDAHMHLMVLGWAGLTVLATLVVFGPALLRARMEPGADARAQTALRVAAVALLVAAVTLVVAGGSGGAIAVAARATASASLVVYGWAVLVVVAAVLRTAQSSDRSSLRWPVFGAAAWLPVGVALDVVVVATTQRRAFDAVGVMLFIGALTQLILAVIMHVGPQLRRRDVATRDALLRRAERFVTTRSAVLNAGVLAVVVGIGGPIVLRADMGPLVRIGWTAIALGILAHLVPVLWPLGPGAGKRQ